MNTGNVNQPKIRPAATVILIRQHAGKLQVHLLKRSRQSGFMTGEIPLSPPTLVTLHELLKYTNVIDLQTENHRRPWGRTRLPRLVPLPQGAVIGQPWDPMYSQEEIKLDPESLPARVLPVGESFSRIWCDKGIWKPIGLKN
jgi:hypothetical protein